MIVEWAQLRLCCYSYHTNNHLKSHTCISQKLIILYIPIPSLANKNIYTGM